MFGGWLGGREEYHVGDGAWGRNGGEEITKGIERDESRKQEMREDRDGETRRGIMRGKKIKNDSPSLQTTLCWQ